MIVRVQFVTAFDEQPPSIIHKWAIYSVDESYTVLRLFHAIKAGTITFSVFIFICFAHMFPLWRDGDGIFPTIR